ENEVAQSRALGYEFAKVWMHNGMLRFTGEKMSKSLGNVETIEGVLDRWGVETTLLFFLTAHWHSPIDFSDDTMEQARAQWTTLSNAFVLDEQTDAGPEWDELVAVLDDDFNTPAALALMHEWRRVRNLDLLRNALEIFGLAPPDAEAPDRIRVLAGLRQEARQQRDFTESDRLRAEIEAAGWEVRDEAGGYRLVRAG
nr:cysteine--tRNA ligase [Actinomycetota bacterium]